LDKHRKQPVGVYVRIQRLPDDHTDKSVPISVDVVFFCQCWYSHTYKRHGSENIIILQNLCSWYVI